MQIRIISLGEIVTQNIMKGIQAFTSLIVEKKQKITETATDFSPEVGKAVGLTLHKNIALINDFKIGKITEEYFTNQMLLELKINTEIFLTVAEFNQAWNAMNPSFQDFQDLLMQAVEYNNQPMQQIVFVAFTNPKDIRNLMFELDKNYQNYKKDDNGQLIEINGILLYTTYTTNQSKAALIESVIQKLKTNLGSIKPLSSFLFEEAKEEGKEGSTPLKILPALGIFKQKTNEEPNIIYILGINRIEDPVLDVLKQNLEKVNKEIQVKTEENKVATIIWKKYEKESLLSILKNTSPIVTPLELKFL